MSTESYKQFKSDMEWGVVKFSSKSIEDIWESVSYEFPTREELDESELYHEGDFSLFTDSDLYSLIDYLNELSEAEVLTRLHARYGNVIDLYYLDGDDQYVLAYGVR